MVGSTLTPKLKESDKEIYFKDFRKSLELAIFCIPATFLAIIIPFRFNVQLHIFSILLLFSVKVPAQYLTERIKKKHKSSDYFALFVKNKKIRLVLEPFLAGSYVFFVIIRFSVNYQKAALISFSALILGLILEIINLKVVKDKFKLDAIT